MQYINKAYILIGGNMGNRLLYLRQATELLNLECGKIVKASPIYETAAWGNTEQAAFLNQALELQTAFSSQLLMDRLLKTERQIGRERRQKYGPRIIDIDILLFNNEVHLTNQLTIPHPELQNRQFALKPLADIAGDHIHPVLKKTVLQLLAECPDQLPVNKMEFDE